jgi:hypothetical protein
LHVSAVQPLLGEDKNPKPLGNLDSVRRCTEPIRGPEEPEQRPPGLKPVVVTDGDGTWLTHISDGPWLDRSAYRADGSEVEDKYPDVPTRPVTPPEHLAKVEAARKRLKEDRYFDYTSLSGAESRLDYCRAKTILHGRGDLNSDETIVLTENARWVLLHIPFPDVDGEESKVEVRRGIELKPDDASSWCMHGDYVHQDSCGRPVFELDADGDPRPPDGGLPCGLLPVAGASARVRDWRAGVLVANGTADDECGTPVKAAERQSEAPAMRAKGPTGLATTARQVPKEPEPIDWEAWRLWKKQGLKQQAIAEMLSREYWEMNIDQSWVSRRCAKVRRYIEAADKAKEGRP